MKNIDSDLIRGNIDTIILTTMLDGDKYGLDIIKEVEIRSNGTYELKQPTLYSCLKRLENQELISSYWLDSDIGGRRHYYKLTEKGKESLLQKQEEWAKSKFIIDNLLSNHDYDEYRLVKKTDYEKIIEGKQFEYTPENSPALSVSENDDEPELNEEEIADEDEIDSADEPVSNFDELDDVEDNSVFENDEEPETIEDLDEMEELEIDSEDKDVRIDYHDDSDEAEADYPNQKRFKIPSIYDKINIDENEILSDNDEIEEENEDDYTASIYSENLVNDENDDFLSDEDETIDLDEIDEETENEENLSEFDADEFMLGDKSSEEDEDDDDRVYVSSYETEDNDDDLNISVSPVSDQTQNELNILSRLRMQDDEEVNEYIGDKNSYINHLNQNDEIENLKRDDLNVVQEDLLSVGYLSQSTVDDKIDEFSSAIDELNKFNSEALDEIEEDEELETEIEEELINSSNTHEDAENVIEFKEDKKEDAENFDDYLSELDELQETENNGFFNSLDSAEYAPSKHSEFENLKTFDSLDDFGETDSSDAAFEKQFEDYNSQYGYNNSDNNSSDDYFEKSVEETDYQETTPLSSFDDIISRSVTDYTNDTTKFMTSEEFQSFTPRYTENNYKQKLNNLSAYSKVNSEEPETESKEPSEDVMNKVKDIQTLKAEFEDEGICVKEYKKSNGHDDVDRNYLLVNKINLVKSLILLFGYVFVLSAVYIIMNNTSAQTIHNFSFKYFLYGFIPFGIYALYHAVMFVINPYKKMPAKFAPRIMIFISVIITIQLLLITYCVNLQLGFYSFSQNYYNHLIWVIPTIISFAPIISNLIYMALYYSRNFNV